MSGDPPPRVPAMSCSEAGSRSRYDEMISAPAEHSLSPASLPGNDPGTYVTEADIRLMQGRDVISVSFANPVPVSSGPSADDPLYVFAGSNRHVSYSKFFL